jgi:hypothetical protein
MMNDQGLQALSSFLAVITGLFRTRHASQARPGQVRYIDWRALPKSGWPE